MALQMHSERRTFHDDLSLGDPRSNGLDVRAKWDRCAVRDGQAAHREVDHQPRIFVRRKGVAVYGALGADREFTTEAFALLEADCRYRVSVWLLW